MAEHTLMTVNGPGRGGTHSADRKWTGTWQNTLCRLEIDSGRGRTHFADQKLTQDMAEHILTTRNFSGT